MELAVITDEADEHGRKIEARAEKLKIELRLQRVTRTVTRVRLAVSEGMFRKDRATASEIITQLERTVEDTASASIASRTRRSMRAQPAHRAPRAPVVDNEPRAGDRRLGVAVRM